MTILEPLLYANGALRLTRHGAGRGDTVLVYDDTTFGRQRQFSVPDNETAYLQDEIKAWLGSGHPIWYAFDRMQHEFAPIEREPYLPTSAADR